MKVLWKSIQDAVMAFLGQKKASDQKILQDIYRGMLDDVKKEYERKISERDLDIERFKKIIESFREKHPENGEELDWWLKREEFLHAELIGKIQESRDLKEELIFLRGEFELFKKKHNLK